MTANSDCDIDNISSFGNACSSEIVGRQPGPMRACLLPQGHCRVPPVADGRQDALHVYAVRLAVAATTARVGAAAGVDAPMPPGRFVFDLATLTCEPLEQEMQGGTAGG